MDNSRKKSFATHRSPATTDAERRRIGRIIHDDRGNASVDWRDAPADYKRAVLEIEGESQNPLAIKKAPRTFNPYECATLPEEKKAVAPRKDLKKLSEWIKLMRDLEERKRNGEVE